MSMEKFADHVIAVAQKNNISITNLQLQKVMHFVLKQAKEDKILPTEQLEEIYDEPFQVWAYGPTVRGQYNRFRQFASAPIIGKFHQERSLIKLNSVIKKLLEENIFVLVDRSHENSFWQENKNQISDFRSNVDYTLGDL